MKPIKSLSYRDYTINFAFKPPYIHYYIEKKSGDTMDISKPYNSIYEALFDAKYDIDAYIDDLLSNIPF